MNYEWYQIEPYCRKRYDSPEHDYDIPRIIAEAVRRERGETTVKYIYTESLLAVIHECLSCKEQILSTTELDAKPPRLCPHCGKSIKWD